MTRRRVPGERLFRLLLRLHPRRFRERYADEMIAFFREAWHDQAEGRGAPAVLAFWARTVLGTAAAALAQRVGVASVPANGGAPAERISVGSSQGDGDARGTVAGWSADLARDAHYAFRSLARQPGFAAVTILTLAVGIGANAAVFSVLHSVLLAPLPYDEPGRLVRMYRAEGGSERGNMNELAFADFRERLTSVQIAAFDNYGGREFGADIIVEGRPERVRLQPVSADYFDVLGAEVILGRPFTRDDERSGAAPVAVISERLWRRAMQADPGAIRGSLSLDGVSHRVSGVVSSDFADPIVGTVDVWVPQEFRTGPFQWQNNYLTVLGRLSPGVSLQRARAEVTQRSEVHREVAEGRLEDDYRGVLVPLQDDLAGPAEPMLLVLMGAVALLLLITCANVTALVLARGVARGRELSIRAALGSGRGRLVRQLAIESLVLAGLGAGAGLAAGALVQGALVAVAPAALPQAAALGYGWPVAIFAGGLALVVGLVVGGLPALRVTRSGLESGVRNEVRMGVERAEHQRMRRALVVAEVSLAVVLLVGAGLLLSSLQHLRSLDIGVDADDIWTFQVHLPDARYGEPAERVRFHAALHERLRSIPGVESVGAASRLPATGFYHGPWGIHADGADRRVPGAQVRVIQGDWFETLDVELLEGRLFGPEDGPGAPRRAVVSEAMANALFPGESALGRRVDDMYADPLEIIGVVETVPFTPRGQPAPTLYRAHAQFADNRNWPLFQVVEMSQPVPRLIESARAELAELDPYLVLAEPERLPTVLGRETARDRFASLLVAVFAVLAVSLAALGIYGILAYDVSRSRHEIGVRMALGAGAEDVRRMVVRRGLALTAGGVAAGALGALALSRLLRSLLFEVSPTDPRVFAAAVAAVLAIGAAASWLPARRATGVEPAEAFRGR